MDMVQKTTRVSGTKILIKVVHDRYISQLSKDQVNVLGISDCVNKTNMQTFQNLFNDLDGFNTQY